MPRKAGLFDVVAITSGGAAVLLNLFAFLPMLEEQIRLWGEVMGTNYDIGVLGLWLLEIMSLPLLVVVAVYLVIAATKRQFDRYFLIVSLTVGVSVLFIVLTNLFIHF